MKIRNMLRFIIITAASLLLVVGCKRDISDFDGKSAYFDTLVISDQEYQVYTMYDNKKHGVMNWYLNGYGRIQKHLYLEDSLILMEELTFDTIHAHTGYEYLYYLNDTLYYIGSLNFDVMSLEKDQVYCSYFEYSAPDTIRSSESLSIDIIGNIGSFKDFSTQVSLGEINKEDFTLSNIDTIYKSASPEIKIDINGFNEGVNLITGIITYYDNINGKDITNVPFLNKDLKIPLVFYHQFVVVP